MFDVNASVHLSRGLLKELQDAGGEVCRFLPSIFKNIIRINYRMHRKIVVIDGKIGYLGGMNIGDEYMGLAPKISPWRDTHIRIKGSAVHALQIRFLLDWENITFIDLLNQDDIGDYFSESLSSTFRVDTTTNQASVQIISSGSDQTDMNIRNSMITMINSAKENILIQTPYFIPDEPFMQALILAVRTGVNVSIMIPKVPDKPYIYIYATLSYTEELIKYGINIYAYHGFMHAKTLIIDDKICTIGTSNIDYRSFKLNFEINAFIYDVEFSQKYAQIFCMDLERSTLLTHAFYKKRPRVQKILSAISRLLSPLM